MSIEVTCECGKKFSVGDQFAGKRGRCKACGRVVTVPAASDGYDLAEPVEPEPPGTPNPPGIVARSPDVMAASIKPAEANPSNFPQYPPFSKPARVEQKKESRISIHVSPAIVVLVILAIGIPTGIFLVEQGPIKARDQWEALEPTAEANIMTQVTRAIQYQYTRFLSGDSEDERAQIQQRKAINVVFDAPVIAIRLPDSMHIKGRTTEGLFEGVFYPHTMEFEAKVPIMGQIHAVDGSASDDDQSLNLDGQKIN